MTGHPHKVVHIVYCSSKHVAPNYVVNLGFMHVDKRAEDQQ